MSFRVVFDTTTVVSALIFPHGRLAWMRQHWRTFDAVPLIFRATAEDLTRVLAHPKFRLSADARQELLAEYLPYCEIVKVGRHCPVTCRDRADQPFLDLAYAGKADILVSGDHDLLAVANKTRFIIETPTNYRDRIEKA